MASTTLTEPLAWNNSSLLRPNVATALQALKQEDGGDLHVIGSAQLVRNLLSDDLVDELRLMIDPLVLGGGKRIFPEDGELRRFRLSIIAAPRWTLSATYASCSPWRTSTTRSSGSADAARSSSAK